MDLKELMVIYNSTLQLLPPNFHVTDTSRYSENMPQISYINYEVVVLWIVNLEELRQC